MGISVNSITTSFDMDAMYSRPAKVNVIHTTKSTGKIHHFMGYRLVNGVTCDTARCAQVMHFLPLNRLVPLLHVICMSDLLANKVYHGCTYGTKS